MKSIRRLYFYAVAAISVEVVLWGIVSLLRSIFNNSVSGGTTLLAQALSLILVGVPIFVVHWLWAQNVSAKDSEENSASLRAIFLYGILLGTLIPVVQNLLALINRVFLTSANLYSYRAIVGGSQTWSDNLIAIVINLLIALYFWNVLKRNWRQLNETENFSEIRRLYRFIWMLYGLLMTVYGAQQVLDFIFTWQNNLLGDNGREQVVNALALLALGTPIWYFAWRVLQSALPDSAERDSYLRLSVLYILTLGSAIIVLSTGGNLIYQILKELFSQEKSGWQDFIRELGNPISSGLPFGLIWAYYGGWLTQQFNFDENLPRRAGKQRLYFYVLAFLGLAASFIAIDSLVDVVFDMLTGDASLRNFSSTVSGALAALIVGLPLWLRTWIPMQSQALQSSAIGDHARRSVIRRFYLYLVLFVSVIGGMIAAGIFIFILINSTLSGEFGKLGEMSHPFQTLVLFAVLLLYHLFVLRKDTASKADVLEEKQAQFNVLIFDHNGSFGEAVKAGFAKRAPKVPVAVVNANEKIAVELKANAIVLPASLAVNPPENAAVWIKSFNGTKLIVSDEAAGVLWMNDFEQAADSAQALAEGQEIRPQSSKREISIWTYVAYVFAGLFACQLLLMLLLFGVSVVTGF
ncbi:MAG: DUF5671 domain-containing protein [Anaerolineales bacterium]|nr:DUF5671 domain-containing protein [Anaerolineales bacterium]